MGTVMPASIEHWKSELSSLTTQERAELARFLIGSLHDEIDPVSMKTVAEGFDWRSSIFNDPALKHLCGIIWFNMGNYGDRHLISNPFYAVQADFDGE